MFGYGRCPRCGGGCMEYLATHAHCWECNYFPEDSPGVRQWLSLEFRTAVPGAARSYEDARILRGNCGFDPSRERGTP